MKLQTSTFNAGPAAVGALFAGALDASYAGPNPAINAFIRSHGDAVRMRLQYAREFSDAEGLLVAMVVVLAIRVLIDGFGYVERTIRRHRGLLENSGGEPHPQPPLQVFGEGAFHFKAWWSGSALIERPAAEGCIGTRGRSIQASQQRTPQPRNRAAPCAPPSLEMVAPLLQRLGEGAGG